MNANPLARPRAALLRDDLEFGARWLADILEGHGALPKNFAIALGDGELHVYAGCDEAQWSLPKPAKVAGYPVEWHFGNVGMMLEAAE
jgi:hypothetical protein